MGDRTTQLQEVWRVALARHRGQIHATLNTTPGPLSPSSLTIYLQSLKEMLRGGKYTRALKNDDTDYFLTQIEQELGHEALRRALKALDQHIIYYNGLEKGELRGAREVHDHWKKRLVAGSVSDSRHAPPTTLEQLLAQQADDLAKALARSDAERAVRLSNANIVPKTATVTTTVFLRNQDVVATVLLRAKGKCECCGTGAPFRRRSDGTPYLEVHHKHLLAEGGKDTVDNAIALCPNCHREAHHDINRLKFRP